MLMQYVMIAGEVPLKEAALVRGIKGLNNGNQMALIQSAATDFGVVGLLNRKAKRIMMKKFGIDMFR